MVDASAIMPHQKLYSCRERTYFENFVVYSYLI